MLDDSILEQTLQKSGNRPFRSCELAHSFLNSFPRKPGNSPISLEDALTVSPANTRMLEVFHGEVPKLSEGAVATATFVTLCRHNQVKTGQPAPRPWEISGEHAEGVREHLRQIEEEVPIDAAWYRLGPASGQTIEMPHMNSVYLGDVHRGRHVVHFGYYNKYSERGIDPNQAPTGEVLRTLTGDLTRDNLFQACLELAPNAENIFLAFRKQGDEWIADIVQVPEELGCCRYIF